MSRPDGVSKPDGSQHARRGQRARQQVSENCRDGDESAAEYRCPGAPSTRRAGFANLLDRTLYSRDLPRATGIRIALQALQVGAHFRGDLVTQVAVFLQRLVDNSFEFRGTIGIQPHGRNRGAVQDRFENRCRTVATERHPPRRHLIENSPKREQIAPRIQFLRPRLLRRHVSDGAERRTGTGQVRPFLDCGHLRVCGSRCISQPVAGGRHLCKAKVQNLGVAPFGHKNVGGLDVAMDDSFGVSGVQSIGNVNRQAE